MQVSLFDWRDKVGIREYPELELLHAIPNASPANKLLRAKGGKDAMIVAAYMKAEGLLKGFPDVCLPVSRGTYHALYLELKAPGGALSPEQSHIHELLRGEGSLVEVVKGKWEAGATMILRYLRLPRFKLVNFDAPTIPLAHR
jgi:hypothetical protein